ncbi:SulP family inorganic anion transporter [Alkalimarinus alittae]|uniref:Sulfate permease n=1 Tax=Alkalimarinus alittae TaxID=2961619 RepID=A0ABY6N091_9ALTE|nr:sulfate permease [Alkalimarinus alittae]UZE95504.1 sulfate permease [Alkalimarinus alittae]
MSSINLSKRVPFLKWAKSYNRTTFVADSVAAMVITIMLIPQSLAYAMLAGLPPQLGLYASLLPLVAYALLGSSGPLSVGPFAITSIMTATALAATFPEALTSEYVAGAVILAFMTGAFLLAFGIFRLGFLTNFISFPVVTGFISASAIVIASSQVGNLLGISTNTSSFFEVITSTAQHIHQTHFETFLLGLCSIAFLYGAPKIIRALVLKLTSSYFIADSLSRTAPILAMLGAISVVLMFDLEHNGVVLLGDIPQGLPALALPNWQPINWDFKTWKSLASSALLISIIGFVSSLSAAQAFAAKQRQRINPNQEALSLGVANISAGLSGAFPVAASLSRSAVSFNAGAKTPATSAFTAIGMAVSCLFLTPYLYSLPVVTLAALILLAVLSLFDFNAMKRTWAFNRQDFSALFITMILTLLNGVEWGLVSGVMLSIGLHLYRSSHPHVAILGRVPATEHFRNIDRHDVMTDPEIVSFRVDASLYFANARFLEDRVNELVASHPKAKHLILMCSAINDIDASALESLYDINQHLKDAGMQLHLSEVKGPILDRIKRSDFLEEMTGNLYLSHYLAWKDLTNQPMAGSIADR